MFCPTKKVLIRKLHSVHRPFCVSGVMILVMLGLSFFSTASAQTGGIVFLSDEAGNPGDTVAITFIYFEETGFPALQAEAVISDPSVFTYIDVSANCDGWSGAVVASCRLSNDGTRLQFAAAVAANQTLPSHQFDILFEIDSTINPVSLPITVDLEWDTADPDFTPDFALDGSVTIVEP